jgi:hypothetical protein
MPMSTKYQKKKREKNDNYCHTIGYDIYDRFTVEYFPLRQSIILTTIFFFPRDSTSGKFSFLVFFATNCNQEELFELEIQYNTATVYVLLAYLTDNSLI